MKRLWWGITILGLLLLLPGCGSDKEKNQNRHRDMPRSTPEKENK
jgi:hypothetical protein